MKLTEQSFYKAIDGHTMTIKRDDGGYRHLTFSSAGSSLYRFDIVTYPGFLVYSGDMGCYVFQRLTDMFDLFRCDSSRKEYLASQGLTLGVDHGYWAEKLQATPDREGRGCEFDEDLFVRRTKEHVLQWCRNHRDSVTKEDRRELWDAVIDEVIGADGDRHGILQTTAAYEFHHLFRDGARSFHMSDFVSDCRFESYTLRYQWCCFALAWGIQQYDNKTITA